jgi:FKBP-type peptidyl-prolyl cis-trans isomerase FklB
MKLKSTLIALVACAGCAALTSLPALAQDGIAKLPTDKDKISYAIGLDVARNFRKNNIDFDPDLVVKGLRDGLSGERPLLKEKELRMVLNEFQNSVRQRMSLNQRVLVADNRRKALAFLEANRNQPGVQTLLGGIQYKVLRAAEGPRAGDLDSVQLHFRGTLLDGSEFDGTETGKPGTLALVNAINGLKTTLKAMPEGSRWQVWIPPQLGYGERGVGSEVGPNELLTFDIELLRVLPGQAR